MAAWPSSAAWTGCCAWPRSYDLAVSLHSAATATPATLAGAAAPPHRAEPVFHWHKASSEVTRDIVAAGDFVSVTPEVCLPGARPGALVEQVPLVCCWWESDAPWKDGGEFAGL